MKNLEILVKQPLFYITRDIERAAAAVGMPGVFIISNLTEYSKKFALGQEQILLISSEKLLDTWEILSHPETSLFLQNYSTGTPNVLVFKNTSQIERICAEKGYALLNPPAALSSRIEEKITQVEWLGELAQYLPPHKIQIASEVVFEGTPFILQFNRAHTGLGTMLIDSAEALHAVQEKFPNRPVRVTKFISGPMLTSNNVVGADSTLIGNISYQITGLEPFTDNAFTTIGNDWALPVQLLADELLTQYNKIVEAIAGKLRADGWKGLFGVDIVLDEAAQKFYLIEINARQPASTTFESQLQELTRKNENDMTTFEAHLAALLGMPLAHAKLIKIHDGAQIIQRVTARVVSGEITQTSMIEQLEQLHPYNIISYSNTELGSDWIRIQSKDALMQAPTELNMLGLSFQNILLA